MVVVVVVVVVAVVVIGGHPLTVKGVLFLARWSARV